jgi:Major tropism determinant N-terminal domain
MGQRIKQRRDTSANWAASTVPLADGEHGYDKTLKQYKTGDGTALWPALAWDRIDAANVDNLPAGGQSAAQVDAAIVAKGYQTSTQVNSAITAAGGQTASQVSAAITAAGGQTAAQVDSAIVAKGYQTAAQVAALVIDGGNAAG